MPRTSSQADANQASSVRTLTVILAAVELVLADDERYKSNAVGAVLRSKSTPNPPRPTATASAASACASLFPRPKTIANHEAT